MVRRPRLKIELSKHEIFRRDNYTCQYCGYRNKRLTIDHVIPKSSGGDHTWRNIVATVHVTLGKGIINYLLELT